MAEHRVTGDDLRAGKPIRLAQNQRHTVIVPNEGALIIYGYGADLGSFGVFARALANRLRPRYGSKIVVANKERKADFIAAIADHTAFNIKELHVFSHSFGAGLALAYHNPVTNQLRDQFINDSQAAGHTITFDEVLAQEVGILFTDDLLAMPDATRDQCRSRFAHPCTLQIWGCRAADANWSYYDDPGETPYWAILNSQNTPKPSIAKALQDFLGIDEAKAASSGSHLEVYDTDSKKWITSDDYKKKTGHWPGPSLDQRLQPDRGGYATVSQ
jgi:hypothetical protein